MSGLSLYVCMSLLLSVFVRCVCMGGSDGVYVCRSASGGFSETAGFMVGWMLFFEPPTEKRLGCGLCMYVCMYTINVCMYVCACIQERMFTKFSI